MLLISSVGLSPAGPPDDPVAVKWKLDDAKRAYDADLAKFKQAITEWLDKREGAARKSGDKALAAQAKAEREAFASRGESPAGLPAAARQQILAARCKLDRAYAAAAKDYTRLRRSEELAAAEKEHKDFLIVSMLMIGKRTNLASLRHFDLKAPDRGFANDGTHCSTGEKIKVDGELIPHSIMLHPPAEGNSQVSYPLAGKYAGFRVTVGVPKIEAGTADPASPLTFEIIGDGKSLWRSGAVQKIDTFEAYTVKVDRVQVLTLRVDCPNKNDWARAVWFEPILLELP